MPYPGRPLKSTQIIHVPKSEFLEYAFEPFSSHHFSLILPPLFPLQALSGTKIASQNRSDHGGRKWARNLQKSHGFSLRRSQKKSLAASDFWVTLKIAGSSQRPWPQVAAAAGFCGRSDHGTLSSGPVPSLSC